MSHVKKVVREDVDNPNGTFHTVEHTITYAKIKKDVVRRAQLKPFGQVSQQKGTQVTGQEKPIEIRCLLQTKAVIAAEGDENVNDDDDAILEQIQTAPRCKLCGLEGHFSLKCPKRKEIEVGPVKRDDLPPEITILVTDISDMTSEADLQDLIAGLRDGINEKFMQQARSGSIPGYAPIRFMKISMPRDRDGNYRGIAYINIPHSPSAELLANDLVQQLDGAKLGMVLIHAVIPPPSDKKRKGPNRYDDEEKYGHLGGRK